MVVYNAITGLKRKLPAYRLPRKKRASHASTVASRMYSEKALENAGVYLGGSKQYLAYYVVFGNINHPNAVLLSTLCFLFAAFSCVSKAARYLLLDSCLMDIQEEEAEDNGYHYPLVGIR
jgi:hypothetical protein